MTTPAEADWYDDPDDPNAQRWWDGQNWTPHRRRKPRAASTPADDPASASPVAQQPLPPPPVMPTAAAGGPPRRSRKPVKVAAVAIAVVALCAAAGVVGVRMFNSGKHSASGTSSAAGSSMPIGASSPANSGAPITNAAPSAPNGASETAAPAPTSSAQVTSGILAVDTSKNNQRTYGYIDPTSGQYSQVAQFNIPTNSQGIPYLAIAASPDLTKFALSEQVDGQQVAGWIDTQGNFTNVTPAASTGAFGGLPPEYIAVGFDGTGNFYYREQSQGSLHPQMFELAAGTTSNPREITSKAAQEGTLSVYLNYDGTLQFGCNEVLSWLGPSTEVFVAGGATQIDKREHTHTDVAGCFDQGHDTPLLPAANAAHVANAVGKHDGTMVAFKYDARDRPDKSTFVNGSDLYIVAADGSAQPTQVNLTNLTPQQLAFMTLLKWV